MALFRTGNPTLGTHSFDVPRVHGEDAMTLPGTVNKTGISLLLLLGAAAFTWNQTASPIFIIVGALGGFVVALVTSFKREWAPITTPIYAVLEGLFLGGLSLTYERRFPGIVINAVGLTFGTLAALLLAYRSGLIKATENFKLGVFAATGGIALLYLVSMGLGFFGVRIPFIHGSGIIGIGFSLFVVGLAALNLVLDFDFIERGAEAGAPKYMEWYGAFGLLVTLVWLYLEILRLLAKLQSRDRK
ncbi:MAG TPA: Bax inhibitor-1/YccA family protein [Vicinamibacteria bacterium]|nr:Bax inhibitor-1/YccA family protein [Vicinamibacteria bacterium]